MKISIAHSPDADDAFMFYALSQGKIAANGFEITHILKDIETLNREAMQGTYEISAISFHAFPYIADKYALMECGASMGDLYGPMVVAKEPFSLAELKNKKIAVPGTLTTAFLVLRLLEPDLDFEVCPFNQIIEKVARGEADAGLIIHEGQLSYRESGLSLVVDLGKWWHGQTGLPLPLGGNVIRKDLGDHVMKELPRLVKESISYGLAHKEEALSHAIGYSRGLSLTQADRFVSMYVNRRTLEYQDDGKRAVHTLLHWAHEKNLIPTLPAIEFVG